MNGSSITQHFAVPNTVVFNSNDTSVPSLVPRSLWGQKRQQPGYEATLLHTKYSTASVTYITCICECSTCR